METPVLPEGPPPPGLSFVRVLVALTLIAGIAGSAAYAITRPWARATQTVSARYAPDVGARLALARGAEAAGARGLRAGGVKPRRVRWRDIHFIACHITLKPEGNYSHWADSAWGSSGRIRSRSSETTTLRQLTAVRTAHRLALTAASCPGPTSWVRRRRARGCRAAGRQAC